MKNENENVEIYDGESVVTLTCDDGTTVDLYELAGVEYEGQCYAIVEPVEEMEDVEEGEVFIFRIEELEDGSYRYDDDVTEEVMDAVFAEYLRALPDDCCGDCEDCDGNCEDGE